MASTALNEPTAADQPGGLLRGSLGDRPGLADVRRLGLRGLLPLGVRLLRGYWYYRCFDTKNLVFIDRRLYLDKQHAEIHLGRVVSFGSDVGLSVLGSGPSDRACLRIGAHTHIQARTHINCRRSISIGSYCAISWDVEILDTDIHAIVDAGGEARARNAPVTIEDRVWIGARSIVLKGVTIGHDSVVGAGSVVTSSIPPHSLYAGNPARVVQQIEGWQI